MVLLRTLGVLLALVVGVAAAAAGLVLFPPAALLLQAAVPLARTTLDHPNLDLASLKASIGSRGHIEVRGLQIGPPAGFRLPLLSVGRLSVAYDARGITRGHVSLERLEIERPTLHVEHRQGQANWQAFLQQIGAGQPTAGPTDSVQAEPTEPPPDLDLEIKRIAVTDLSAFFDDEQRRVILDALNFELRAHYRPNKTTGRFSLRIAPRGKQTASVALLARAPERLRALFDLDVKLDATLHRLQPLAAQALLQINATSRRLESRWDLRPVNLSLVAAVDADQGDNTARLRELTLHFNGQELLRTTATASDASSPDPRVDLRLTHATVPLKTLAPYLRLLLPQLDCGGRIRLENLHLTTPLSQAGSRLPDALAGRIAFDSVHVALAPGHGATPGPAGAGLTTGLGRVDLAGLHGHIGFQANATDSAGWSPLRLSQHLPEAADPISRDATEQQRPQQRDQPPAVLTGQLRIAHFRAAGAALSNLALDLAVAASLKALEPQAAAVTLALRLPRLRYRHPELGPLRGAAQVTLQANADLQRRSVELSGLQLTLNDVVHLHLRARAEDYGNKSLSAKIELPKLSLARLTQRLPAGLTARLPLRDLSGHLSLSASARGRLPAPQTPLLKLPLTIDLKTRLRGVSLAQLAAGPDGKPLEAARVRGLDADVRLTGRPARMHVRSSVAIQTLSAPLDGLQVHDLKLPLHLGWTSRSASASLTLKAARVALDQPGMALAQRDLDVRTSVRAGLPLARVIDGRPATLRSLNVEATGRVGGLRLRQPGTRLKLTDATVALSLDRKPGGQLSWSTQLGVEALNEDAQGLDLDQLTLRLGGDLDGMRLRLPTPSVDLQHVAARVDGGLRIGKVAYPAALVRDLHDTRVDLAVRLRRDGPLRLSRLAVAVPSYGGHLTFSGQLARPWTLLTGIRQLPDFECALKAGLDLPHAQSPEQALELDRDVRAAGKIGFELNASRADAQHLQLDGQLTADQFHLWIADQPRPVQPDTPGGTPRTLTTSIHLANLRAAMPIHQRLRVAGAPLQVTIPPPVHSIFDEGARGAAYRYVRPFTAHSATLTLDQVTLTNALTQPRPDGTGAHVLSRSQIGLGKTSLDLAVSDSAIRIERLAVKLFGGDIVGRLKLQVPRIDPLDVRLMADTQLTDVDLAHLDPTAKQRGEITRISALTRMRYQLGTQSVSGRILLTDLSLETLDRLLVYLDPHGIDESVQANRRLINAWYTRAANPQVEKVSVWIDHSQLNLDIRLGALWPFGAILRRALSDVRIRRVSIKPFLPEGGNQRPPHAPRSARRNPGW